MLDAAIAMKLSAKNLLELKVIDEIILEPIGGAHRDRSQILINIKKSITNNLNHFRDMTQDQIINQRKNKFLKIGRQKGFMTNDDDLSYLKQKNINISYFLKSKKIIISLISLVVISAFLLFFIL